MSKRNTRNLKKIVKSVILKGKESKRVSNTWTNTPVADHALGGITHDFTGIASGSGNNQRDGHKVKLSWLYGQFAMMFNDTTNIIRVVVARGKGAYTATPFATVAVNTPIDLDQFDIAYDKLHLTSNIGPGVKNFGFKIKVSSKRGSMVTFNGTGATTVTENPWYLYMVSDSGAVLHPTITGQVRTFFKEV